MIMQQSVRIVLIIGAILACGIVSIGWAQQGKTIEQMIVEATTAADYEAIAVYDEHEAQAVRQGQQQHEREKKWAHQRSRVGPTRRTGLVAQHAASIAKHEQLAEEYETLAKRSRTLATGVR